MRVKATTCLDLIAALALRRPLCLSAVGGGADILRELVPWAKAGVAPVNGRFILLAACSVAARILYKSLARRHPVFDVVGGRSASSAPRQWVCLHPLWRHRRVDVSMNSAWECPRNGIASNLSMFVATGAVCHRFMFAGHHGRPRPGVALVALCGSRHLAGDGGTAFGLKVTP